MARTRQTHAQRVANYLAKHPGATHEAARGHGAHLRPPGTTEYSEKKRKAEEKRIATGSGLTKTQENAIRRWFRDQAAKFNAKAEAAGDSDRIDPAHARAMGDLAVANFSHATYAKWLELVAAASDVQTTSEFFTTYAAIPYRGQSNREASNEAFQEAMMAQLGMTIDPALDFFLGGPSPKGAKGTPGEGGSRRTPRQRATRRAIQRGAAGRPRRGRRAAA